MDVLRGMHPPLGFSQSAQYGGGAAVGAGVAIFETDRSDAVVWLEPGGTWAGGATSLVVDTSAWSAFSAIRYAIGRGTNRTNLVLQGAGAFRVSQLTDTQRGNVLSVENGMIIYNTTSNELQARVNGAWTALSGGLALDGTPASMWYVDNDAGTALAQSELRLGGGTGSLEGRWRVLTLHQNNALDLYHETSPDGSAWTVATACELRLQYAGGATTPARNCALVFYGASGGALRNIRLALDSSGNFNITADSTNRNLRIQTFGEMAFAGASRFEGTISPAQITGTTHNYNPAGLSTAYHLRLDLDAARTITGIVPSMAAGQNDGRTLVITNISAFNLTLQHDNGADSTAANRFSLANNANRVVAPNESVEIYYDDISDRWRIVD
jgi:hypothetical protein